MPEAAGFLGFARRRLGVSPYEELADPISNAVDRWLDRRVGAVLSRTPFMRWSLAREARLIERAGPALRNLDDDELRNRVWQLRHRLLSRPSDRRATREAFALVREIADRMLGKRLYRVQLMGAVGLYRGLMVEMATGEGKTLTGLPAAVVAALTGRPVHVVTVNDYLAERDAEELTPVFDAFGLAVAVIDSDMETDARQQAYQADVTFISNKNLTFDYLRDRVGLGQKRSAGRARVRALTGTDGAPPLMLRGLAFAIVDEADSVLVDEARTPLILSTTADDPEADRLYRQALDLARQLSAGLDFEQDVMRRHITLTERGKDTATVAAEGWSGLWQIRRAREELVTQALSALHLFQTGHDYIVEEGEVRIVDEYTGRTMPDRSWQGGLHQMIEAKEGVEITGRKETMARITYQRFFRRYLKLAGMSGTCTELAGEFRDTFGFALVRIPTHRRNRRRHVTTRLLRTSDARWAAVARSVAARHHAGQPVLVGTRSVEASERAAAELSALGLRCEVLNARQTAEEAAVVSRAGQSGAITIATNIAGRGTDIGLGPGVAEAGGLHVVLTEFHESSRIDRQLYGRSGRQGDPGSTEAIVCVDDELFERYARRLQPIARALPVRPVAWLLRRVAQARAEREHAETRREQTSVDRRLEEALAFAGAQE